MGAITWLKAMYEYIAKNIVFALDEALFYATENAYHSDNFLTFLNLIIKVKSHLNKRQNRQLKKIIFAGTVSCF